MTSVILSRILRKFASSKSNTRTFDLFVQKRSCYETKSQFLQRGNDKSIAYRQLLGDNPGIIFCPGFQSTMHGVKASALEEYCRSKKLSFVRFDYQGCGESSGDLREATFTDWKADLLTVLDQITAGPQILVGSSMGGLLMLHAALERPHRIHALVGIATSTDFPRRIFKRFPQEVQESLKKQGETEYTVEDGHSYLITQKFLDDLNDKNNLLDNDFIPVTCPVRLLHGMCDRPVSYELSLELASKLQSRDVHVMLRKAGDHRFSQADDIMILFEVMDYLIYGAPEAKSLAVDNWASFTAIQGKQDLIWKDMLLHKY